MIFDILIATIVIILVVVLLVTWLNKKKNQT